MASLEVGMNKAMRQTTMAEAQKLIDQPSPFQQRGSIGEDLKEVKTHYDRIHNRTYHSSLSHFAERPEHAHIKRL